MIETSFVLTAHPAAALHLLLPDLIYFPSSDFYSRSHTPPWLQAARLIEYIVSEAAADSRRKLSALYLSCQDFFRFVFTSCLLHQPAFQGSLQHRLRLSGCLFSSSLFYRQIQIVCRAISQTGRTLFMYLWLFFFSPKLFSHNTGSVEMYSSNKWMQVLSRPTIEPDNSHFYFEGETETECSLKACLTLASVRTALLIHDMENSPICLPSAGHALMFTGATEVNDSYVC